MSEPKKNPLVPDAFYTGRHHVGACQGRIEIDILPYPEGGKKVHWISSEHSEMRDDDL